MILYFNFLRKTGCKMFQTRFCIKTSNLWLNKKLDLIGYPTLILKRSDKKFHHIYWYLLVLHFP